MNTYIAGKQHDDAEQYRADIETATMTDATDRLDAHLKDIVCCSCCTGHPCKEHTNID